MADATATLQLDATGVERGAKQAEQAFNRVASADAKFRKQVSGKRVEDGLDRTVKRLGDTNRAYQGLFETERKVKTNLAGLVSDLSNVNTTGQAAAVTIGRLTETMRIGFAANVGIAVGMAVNQVITDTAASMEGLTDKWQDLLKLDSQNAGDSDLVQNLQKAADLAKIARQESEKISSKLIPSFGDGTASAGFATIAEGAEAQRSKISSALVERAEKSARTASRLAQGDDRAVGIEAIQDQRKDAISKVKLLDLNPGDRAKMIELINKEFGSMLDQITQKFALATATAVEKSKQVFLSEELERISPLMDSRDVESRKLRNKLLATRAEGELAATAFKNHPFDDDAREASNTAMERSKTALNAFNMRRFAGAIDPRTGQLRSSASRLSDVRARQRRTRNMEESAGKFERDKGLVRVHRGSGGQAIGGIDPETGEAVGTARAAQDDLSRLRSGALNNPVGVGDSFGKRSAMDWGLSLFGGSGGSAATRATAESESMKAPELSSMEKSLKEIATKLSKMLN